MVALWWAVSPTAGQVSRYLLPTDGLCQGASSSRTTKRSPSQQLRLCIDHADRAETFVLFGYLAAFSSLELVTGILILPQRQTVLVAKQAAEVDLLSEGRLRLGIGIGWNHVEYDALGQDFSTRGRRIEEQVGLLRRLWTEESVTFDGRFDHVSGAGLAPLPVQRPIPVWFGAQSEPALRRAGRLADGWFPQVAPGAGLEEALGVVRSGAAEAGRDPAAIAMEGRIQAGDRVSSGSRVRRRSGSQPALPTWRSTRWVRDWQGSTTTSPPLRMRLRSSSEIEAQSSAVETSPAISSGASRQSDGRSQSARDSAASRAGPACRQLRRRLTEATRPQASGWPRLFGRRPLPT